MYNIYAVYTLCIHSKFTFYVYYVLWISQKLRSNRHFPRKSIFPARISKHTMYIMYMFSPPIPDVCEREGARERVCVRAGNAPLIVVQDAGDSCCQLLLCWYTWMSLFVSIDWITDWITYIHICLCNAPLI